MPEPAFCHNHPNAKSIADCHKCAANLCGMCGNYVDDIVLCERCVEAYENEKFVASQTSKLERPNTTLGEDSAAEETFVPPGAKKNSKLIQGAAIAICAGIISVQLYLYSNPATIAQDPATLARQQAIGSLVQCMLVFREIGLVLQDGRMPNNDMVCADSPAPNIVTNADGSLRISHPNPQYYGYREISVSDTEPEPRVIRIDQ